MEEDLSDRLRAKRVIVETHPDGTKTVVADLDCIEAADERDRQYDQNAAQVVRIAELEALLEMSERRIAEISRIWRDREACSRPVFHERMTAALEK